MKVAIDGNGYSKIKITEIQLSANFQLVPKTFPSN